MDDETLYTGTSYFKPFPNIEDVFAEDIEEHAKYLLPLASIDLAHLSSDWRGWIHLIAPVEPWNNCVGVTTEEFHTDWCKPNWVGYHVLGDKCVLASDFRFFHLARGIDDDRYQPMAELRQFYKNVHRGYQISKQYYEQNGYLNCHRFPSEVSEYHSPSERDVLIAGLGGIPFGGNWSCMGLKEAIPVRDDVIIHNGEEELISIPQTPDGRDYHFVGGIDAFTFSQWRLCGGAGTWTLFFYDPVDQIVLSTFDWS